MPRRPAAPRTAKPSRRTPGRASLAQLSARRAGRPLPARRPPCFFDPRHGPSVTDAGWTPPGGAE
ncbi:hypothetical protein ABZ443_46500, partial [Streptomyces shenzhenensis]